MPKKYSEPLYFKGFPAASYPNLQGSVPLTASWADVTRALLIVGYQNFSKSQAIVGSWRSMMLFSLAYGNLRPDLSSTAYFERLEPSEKVSTSFLLGQGMTYWCAQSHLGVRFLLHVSDRTREYKPLAAGVPGKLGPLQLAPRSRPDFLGIGPGRERHIFESKGRSAKQASVYPGNKLVAEALGQACRIARVHNRTPTTWTACIWTLTKAGMLGWIEDPPPPPGALELDIDLVWSIRRAYSLFLDRNASPEPTVSGADFVQFRVTGEWSIALDRKIYETLQSLRIKNPGTGEQFLSTLEARQADIAGIRQRPGIAGGPDGVFLVGPKDDPRFFHR